VEKGGGGVHHWMRSRGPPNMAVQQIPENEARMRLIDQEMQAETQSREATGGGLPGIRRREATVWRYHRLESLNG